MAAIRTCVFCGASKGLTNEHVLPTWLWGAMRASGPLHISLRKAGGKNRPDREAGSFDIKYGRVCGPCNHDWLGPREDRIKELIGPSLLGTPIVLDSRGMRDLAFWATKTALLWQLANAHRLPGLYTPEGHLAWMRERETLPPDTYVWLGAVDRPDTAHWARSGVIRTTDPEPQGYLSVFSLRFLLFQIIGWNLVDADAGQPREQPMRRRASFAKDDSFLTPLYPYYPGRPTLIEWPPRRILTVEDLDRLWPDS